MHKDPLLISAAEARAKFSTLLRCTKLLTEQLGASQPVTDAADASHLRENGFDKHNSERTKNKKEKKLVETSASLLGTSALLVVTRSY